MLITAVLCDHDLQDHSSGRQISYHTVLLTLFIIAQWPEHARSSQSEYY